MKLAVVALLALTACPPPPAPAPMPPEAGDAANPCATIQAVDRARLIREPDGAAFDRPCPADGGLP